ncbi:hypothetical protein IW261DRAFT_1625393 [Armillaria novae-zelandiae]|uniref:NAD-dependent epimerase/dehydratase domain-containing protein n=1 Tax=Armillaria novae-zelandiae TaxID=153914 RepID=A0AA39UI34_9AGAR|nr:hypothetical protein IW261DRAFT_1625393 [Armillaria novae-zelandiae]
MSTPTKPLSIRGRSIQPQDSSSGASGSLTGASMPMGTPDMRALRAHVGGNGQATLAGIAAHGDVRGHRHPQKTEAPGREDQGAAIFVTGGMGFIGFHILTQLLDKGYSVRVAARGPKVDILKKALSVNYSKNFEVVEVADVTAGDLRVDGIIHSAAPLPGRVDPEMAFKISIEGSLHIIREAIKAKVPRVVATSSIVTYPFPIGPFGVDDWNPITKEEAIVSGSPFHVYVAAAQQRGRPGLVILVYTPSPRGH